MNAKLKKIYDSLSKHSQEKLRQAMSDPVLAEKMYKDLLSEDFKKIPPTPAEFLDPKNGWLNEQVASKVYEHVKKDFCEILDGKSGHTVCMYGSARCEAPGTEILMYDMSIKNIEDIVVGDLLMGDDGTPRTVKTLYRGRGPLYLVEQNKSDPYIVSENHILVLQYTNRGLRKNRNYSKYKDSNTIIEITAKDYTQLSKHRKALLKGITCGAIELKEQPLPIDPYFLGVWLGDGSSANQNITTIDQEIIDYLYEFAETRDLKVTISDGDISYRLSKTSGLTNNLRDDLRLLRIINNKHIPNIYLNNSIDNRLQLLAGLLDTDGYLQINESKNKTSYSYEITQKRKRLADEIRLLCRSLGFRCVLKKCKKGIKSIGFEGTYYRLSIYGDLAKIPTRIKRKQIEDKDYKAKFNPTRTGITVTPFGTGDYYGFELDGNHRYLHSDCTVTHNSGKTTLVHLLIFYTIVYFHHLKNPAKFYNIMSRNLVIYILSFTMGKAKEVYLQPLYNLLEQSERCVQVKFADSVKDQQEAVGVDHIVYSKAAIAGHITLDSGLQIIDGNDEAMRIIGSNIIQTYISEINFFIETAGATEDQIFRLYTDSIDRIRLTVGNQYLAYTYLDSSANTTDSVIENHILKDIANDKDSFFRQRRQWDIPELIEKSFGIWAETKQTFKVITGSGATPAKIVSHQSELIGVDPELIVDVPIDVRPSFERNLLKSIKDIIGRPTSNESKFVQNRDIITRMMTDTISNVEGVVICDSKSAPENYLWNEVHDKFFVKYDGTNWKIKRAPKEPRYFGIDLSHAIRGDLTGISMVHREYSEEANMNICVVDFAFAIGPGENGINIEAVQCFIQDLVVKGNVFIKKVCVDTFQSENLVQFLKRINIDAIKNSTVTSVDPYLRLLTLMLSGTIKCGPNIFLKNNLISLQRLSKKKKEEIDHSKGRRENKYSGDFDNSQAGIHAKDVSDSLAQAIWTLSEENPAPSTFYEKQNERFGPVKVVSMQSKIAEAMKALNATRTS